MSVKALSSVPGHLRHMGIKAIAHCMSALLTLCFV
jgi:hypothetical protein